MKKTLFKTLTLLVALLLSVCSFVACDKEPENDVVPPVEYDEESAVDYVFEAEYATIVGSALKHDYMEYQGNGHIVDGTPSTQLEGGLMALPSNNGLFVGYMGAESGCKVEWVITSTVACKANLAISMSGNYKGAGDAALMAVSVNGKNIEFEPQGSCLSRAFSEGISVVVDIVKGENVIVLTSKDDFTTTHDYWENVNCQRFLDVDYMKLSACVAEGTFTFTNKTEIGADEAHQMNPNGKITKYEPSWHKSAA